MNLLAFVCGLCVAWAVFWYWQAAQEHERAALAQQRADDAEARLECLRSAVESRARLLDSGCGELAAVIVTRQVEEARTPEDVANGGTRFSLN